MIDKNPEKSSRKIKFATFRAILALAIIFACHSSSLAIEAGAPIPPEKFSDDYYKVYGTPNLTLSLERSNVYQGEQTSLFLTLTNRGRITSFQVNEEPGANKREEILGSRARARAGKAEDDRPGRLHTDSWQRTRAPLMFCALQDLPETSERVRPPLDWSFLLKFTGMPALGFTIFGPRSIILTKWMWL